MTTEHARRTATVTDIASPTPEVRVVRMSLGDPLPFEAGQYVRLWFDALPARDYSLGNRPSDPSLEFHIRINSEKGVGRYVGERLRVGESVGLAGPYGDAFLRREHRGPVLAVAGGTGIVPIQSIVETALAEGTTQPVHLYWGVRSDADIYALARFRALAARHRNLRVVCALVHPVSGSPHRAGHVSEVVAEDFCDVAGFKAYVAGPPAMVSAMQAVLLGRGLDPSDLHADPFVPGDHHSQQTTASTS
jgi:CDP-4-dehydro-6-deoxyglucose reductase/ferredoxin-NAD(P)+ reductase (naphthalene dioxygenase ferredoxin-specific)